MVVPVIVLSVPRSGSTLLRFLLGQHPDVYALPETPWLLGSYGPDISVRKLVEHLATHPLGVVRNVSGIERRDVIEAARAFVHRLLAGKCHGVRYIVFKTPDDIRYLDFLIELFPDAKYLHIVRDGRDVALSTLPDFPRIAGFGNASWHRVLRRWAIFEQRIRSSADRIEMHTVRYEDLVSDPRRTIEGICRFLNLDSPERMLQYDKGQGDFPGYERGAQDVLRHDSITTDSVGRWRRTTPSAEMRVACLAYDKILVEYGYAECGYTMLPADPLVACLAAGLRISLNELRSRWAAARTRLRRLA